MAVKTFGAVCILVVCGGYGYYLEWQQRLETHLLHQLIDILDFMECELQYRMTPLPTLCEKCSHEITGSLKTVFIQFSKELSSQILPDPARCMESVLAKSNRIPQETKKALLLLGTQLGRFDLGGQVRCLDSVKNTCGRIIDTLNSEKRINGKHYKTLGLCVGAALVIIFI